MRLPQRLAAVTTAVGIVMTALGTAPAAAANACCWQVDHNRTGGIGVAERDGPFLDQRTGNYGLPAGATIGLWCWSYGERVGPNGNSLWWLVDPGSNRAGFWVADHYLTTPVPNGTPTLTGNCPGADTSPN